MKSAAVMVLAAFVVAAVPARAQDVEATRVPYQKTASVSITAPGGNATIATVPPGKRVVVQAFSARCYSPNAAQRYSLGIGVSAPDPDTGLAVETTHYVALTSQGIYTLPYNAGTLYQWVASALEVHLYAEGGTAIRARWTTANSESAGCTFSVSGFMVTPQ